MLKHTPKIKQIYEEIQRKIFYILPEKSDEIYLYASIIDRLGSIQTGEMYLYFLPKRILKHNFINIYEVPAVYDIEETEYLKLVDMLYDEIKVLRDEYKKTNQKIWSNITISIRKNNFKVEYNYEKIKGGKQEYYDHHIYWRHKYLHIEPHNSKERQAIQDYSFIIKTNKIKPEEYIEGIYIKNIKNVVTYDTIDFNPKQKVEYIATHSKKEKKVINQILSKSL